MEKLNCNKDCKNCEYAIKHVDPTFGKFYMKYICSIDKKERICGADKNK